MARLISGVWIVIACAVLNLGAGCRSSAEGPEGDWQSAEISAGSENFLLVITRSAINGLRYPVGAGFDPSAMQVVTGWRTQLAPFRGQGVRHRAEVRYTPIEMGRWNFEVRVKKQVNMDIVRPLDPTYAEWEWRPDDVEQARILLTQIRALLAEPLEVGDPQPARRSLR